MRYGVAARYQPRLTNLPSVDFLFIRDVSRVHQLSTEDTKWPARLLKNRLEQEFGADSVFMDIDNMHPGDEFDKVIEDNVGKCDVLIALIGPKWLSVVDAAGRPRL